MTRLSITPIPYLGTIVIRQIDGKDFFISTKDSVIISIPSLVFIIKFLIVNKLMDKKVLEGLLEEVCENV